MKDMMSAWYAYFNMSLLRLGGARRHQKRSPARAYRLVAPWRSETKQATADLQFIFREIFVLCYLLRIHPGVRRESNGIGWKAC